MKDILEKIYHQVNMMERCLHLYKGEMEQLGLKPIAEMNISEIVKTAEFICQIRSTHGEGQETDSTA